MIMVHRTSLVGFLLSLFILATATLAATDYEIMCEGMKAEYEKCACTTNPTSTVGFVMPSAFIGCIRPEIEVSVNFTGSNEYLSKMHVEETGFGQRGTYLEFDVNTTAITTCQVTSQGKDCDCTVCEAHGLDIDCNNIPGGGAASTNGTCASLEDLFQYQFERLPPGTSGASHDISEMLFSMVWAGASILVLSCY